LSLFWGRALLERGNTSVVAFIPANVASSNGGRLHPVAVGDTSHALGPRRLGAYRPRCTMDDQGTQPSTSPDASTTSATGTTHGDAPPRKKQKRNKPTLSCEECVERKTKVSALAWRSGSPSMTEDGGSVTALDRIAWRASSDNPRANTRKSPT
jgi:hypothetical protein